MSVIALIGAVGYVFLLVYFFALWARFVLDLVQAFSDSWRPHGVVLVLAEVAYTATDPPIKAVRRVLLTSGYAEPEIAGRELGDVGQMLRKPYTANELVRRVGQLLD